MIRDPLVGWLSDQFSRLTYMIMSDYNEGEIMDM